jgi:diaminopimelate epimerase
MRVTKMHGNGNDYIYYRPASGEDRDWPEIARRVSDRHFGIGSDGSSWPCPRRGRTS